MGSDLEYCKSVMSEELKNEGKRVKSSSWIIEECKIADVGTRLLGISSAEFRELIQMLDWLNCFYYWIP